MAQVHLALLAWLYLVQQDVAAGRLISLSLWILHVLASLLCTRYCKMWQPLDLAFTATCISPSGTLFFASPYCFLHWLVSDRLPIAGRCIFTRHGGTRLSRVQLYKENAPGYPRRPPPFKGDGSFKQKILLISFE